MYNISLYFIYIYLYNLLKRTYVRKTSREELRLNNYPPYTATALLAFTAMGKEGRGKGE